MTSKILGIGPSDAEGNNDEVAPDPPTNDVNINANYDDEKNDYDHLIST